MVTIYHLGRSRSERIVWLMEELGLPYELVKFDRGPDRFAPQDLQQVHPLGRAPVIRDGDVVLAESGAIVEYLITRHGGGRLAVPPSDPGYARYLYWFHYAEGSLMLQLLRESTLVKLVPGARELPGMQRVRATTLQHLGFIEQTLARSDYFAGPAFTAADVMMLFPFTTLLEFLPGTVDLEPYPQLLAYVERIQRRPAYVKALAIADGVQPNKQAQVSPSTP